jgi:hypothetical protein
VGNMLGEWSLVLVDIIRYQDELSCFYIGNVFVFVLFSVFFSNEVFLIHTSIVD